MSELPVPLPPSSEPPPRAFTQGVGTVFQFSGVTLFLLMMSVCCLSSLLSKDYASRPDRMQIGWHFPSDKLDEPSYSYARAMTSSVALGVFFGIALAGVGLGLQAQRRAAPVMAVLITAVGTVFWLVQTVFAIHALRSIGLTLLALAMAGFFVAMLILAIGALRDMRLRPPPPGHELLPADYKVPYSHMHQDPPEVRLARELEQRRERLAVQQKELELLEEKLKRKMGDKER
jgi:lysylphosphatidylglycerol synthetase-like protein (DUF2156 family)